MAVSDTDLWPFESVNCHEWLINLWITSFGHESRTSWAHSLASAKVAIYFEIGVIIITSIGAGSLGSWWSWMAWRIGWTRRRLCMISKIREIGLGACFLGWLASRHSGCVELWIFLQLFHLTFFLLIHRIIHYSSEAIDWHIFCDFRHLFRGTTKFLEVKILIQ